MFAYLFPKDSFIRDTTSLTHLQPQTAPHPLVLGALYTDPIQS